MAPVGSCDKKFSSSYMLLRPEDARLFDLFLVLFSKNIQKRNFVDCPEGTEASFKQRWLICLSVLVQILLQLVSKPMAWFGSFVEMLLNLVSSNNNLLVLLYNIIRGKVVKPDKSSATFLSFIGHTDKRVNLDESIKHDDGRYYAALSIMASKASYENNAFLETTVKEHWQMDFLGSFDFWNDYQEKYTTQAFMFIDKTGDSDVVVVAFRGTQPFDADDWCTDVDLSWYELPGVGKIHSGFMKALGLQKSQGWPKELDQEYRPAFAYYSIRAILRKLLLADENMKFIVTGHSLGGALAILFPAILAIHEETWMLERLEGIYTYGQPRVGDVNFGEFMEEKLNKSFVPYYRIVYSNDIVPRVPFDNSCMMFKHFGNCLFFNSLYVGKVVAEVPNKNYSLLWAIPMFLNAIWELIRSFLLPFLKGRDYIETWVMEGCRVFALVFPGLTAHCPQDYVNSTRLGSSDLFLSNKITQQENIAIKIE